MVFGRWVYIGPYPHGTWVLSLSQCRESVRVGSESVSCHTTLPAELDPALIRQSLLDCMSGTREEPEWERGRERGLRREELGSYALTGQLVVELN